MEVQRCVRTCRGHDLRWGGWGSNPRPKDYETPGHGGAARGPGVRTAGIRTPAPPNEGGFLAHSRVADLGILTARSRPGGMDAMAAARRRQPVRGREIPSRTFDLDTRA
jgi:hypothetical protein